MTPKQERAYSYLRIILGDLYENIHGVGTWDASMDNRVRQIVQDLTDTEDTITRIAKLARSMPEGS